MKTTKVTLDRLNALVAAQPSFEADVSRYLELIKACAKADAECFANEDAATDAERYAACIKLAGERNDLRVKFTRALEKWKL